MDLKPSNLAQVQWYWLACVMLQMVESKFWVQVTHDRLCHTDAFTYL